MTAFIKNLKGKRESENRGEVWATRPEVRARIESLPSFKAVQSEMNQRVAEATQRLRDQKDETAKKQRWKTRSADDKAAECIDTLTGKIKAHGDIGMVNVSTHEEARAKAVEIAERYDKEMKDGK